MKTKRILSILMSVLMVIMMLPTDVFASDSPANVAGGTVTSSMTNFDALLGEGNYEYSDGTLKIVKDLRLGSGLTFDCNGRTLVLDLYGHTLDMVDISLTHKAGTLTITDSLGDGGIKTSGVPIVSNASGLTVSGGTFTSTGNNPALRSEMGNCTISGGTFNGRYALERTCEDYNYTYLRLSGSPVLNGSYDDICLWNPNPIYYDGYVPAPGNGPVSIYLKNFPDNHYGRVVGNWDRSKNISDYFKYSGNETQNDPFLCVEKDFDFIIAEKPYDAWIGTTRLTRLNQGDVFGDGKVSITYTGPNSLYSLNLNNFSYEGAAHAADRGIIDIENYPYEDYKNRFQLLMNVTGTNSIVGRNNTFSGISAGSNNGTFSLNGTGSLSISGCNYGIYMSNGNNWWFTRAANSDIPTLEITSTTAATNKDTYLYPNDDNYKVTLGEESLRKESGNVATQNVKYLKIEQAPPLVTVSITTHPVGTTTLTEGSITGSLTAAGTVTNGSSETPDYQWYSNTINDNSGGTLISGATSPSFEIPKNLTAGTYYYYCTLSANDAETRYTSVAKVVVEAKVVIPTHTHNCGHDNCPDVWENFVVINKNLGATTNPRLTNGNTYYYVLGDNMSSGGFNPSIGSGSTATVYLCLNGQSINDITIPVGVKMYVCDCTDEPGIISARFNVNGTAMLGSGRYSLLRQMGDNAVVHVYGPITLGGYADFSSSGKSITLDNADAKIHFSAQPYAAIKFIPCGEGVFATGWASSYNSSYRPVSSDDAYEVSYNNTTCELSFVRKATAQAPAIDTNVSAGEASYDKGGNAQTLNVAASVADGGTLTYQWYKSETNSTTNGTAISGATGASYTPSTSVVGTAYYYCVVTNTNNGATTSVATNVAKVTINEPVVLHTHCICGETHKAVGDHTAEQAAIWTAWDGTSAIPYDSTTKTAYVYLSADAKRDSKLSVADDYTLNLCLNGHSLSPADGFSSDIFDLNGTLTLTDCVGGGKITGSKLYSVYLRGGTFNMYGGAITESNNSAVEVDHNGTFNMYGGEIKNNKAYRGAGIYHHDGTIRISGGTITGNVAQDEGGAIFSQQSGIEICGNPVIAENFVNSGADGEANQINNIYAYSIEIVGPMTDGASIGMTKGSEEFGYFAIDTYDSSADYCKYFFSDKGYPIYKEDDIYYFGYRITKQPSDTDYSVEVNSTNGASYQWCEVIKGAPVSVDDTYLEDNDGYVIGDYDENGWSALVNSDVSMYFGIEMNANDELTAKFASAPQGEVILVNANTNSFVPVVSGGENTYTFITVDKGPYLLAVFAEDVPTVKATLTKNTLKEVDGKTAATLDTGNLPTGNYTCQITWDYLNTPDDTSDDHILQSVVVEYIVPQYTVSFNANGGSAVESKTCEYNQTITAPDAPTKEGFEFIAWYADLEFSEKWSFETTITEDITLYAKWVQGTVSDHEDHVNEVDVEGLNNIAKAEETDIKLVVQTEPITEGDTEQTAIKGIADAPNNFNFYDITLEKSTGGYVTDATSVIEIKMPYDFSRKTNLKVYRYHNGIPEELAQLEARATAPYVDGKCFIDIANNCIYIYSSKFSTYAVAYDTASSSSGGGVTRYTVKFDTDGGSKIASKTVTRNSKIAEPTAPEKEGYTFMGWFTDESLTVAYDFETKVTKSFTLYAKWEKVDEESENTETHICPSAAFDDLDVNAWYHEDADYVIENGIFKGVGETTFAPSDKLTRAMFVTVLYRMENEPATNRSIPFSDVDMGAYYANAISWAKQNGIVNGVTENEFAPNDYITREQIATIMMRYAVYKGMDAITLEENLHFADADEISEYAVSSMNWAVGKGLINGKSESTLAPKDNATRIEVAAILHRFVGSNK